MARTLGDKLIQTIKNAYINRNPKPSLKSLATEFDVGLSTLKKLSSEQSWPELRTAKDTSRAVGKVEGAKAVTRSRKVNDFDALNNAIADISAEVATIDAKSKEGCATALANLLKAKRELYPPNADELAEIAVKLEITPADFIRALKTKWQENEQQQQSA